MALKGPLRVAVDHVAQALVELDGGHIRGPHEEVYEVAVVHLFAHLTKLDMKRYVVYKQIYTNKYIYICDIVI